MPSETDEAKRDLRRRMRRLRAGLDADGLADAGRRIAERLRDLAAVRQAAIIGTYHAIRREVPTDPIRDVVEARWAIPRIEHDAMVLVLEVEPLVDGPFGIPTSTGPVVVPQVVLVPGLAFDVEGRRLGWGGGYYDRYLVAHPPVVTVGLALDAAIVEQVPADPHDQRIDFVVTPTRSWRSGKADIE